MNKDVKYQELIEQIFACSNQTFNEVALAVAKYQYQYNFLYQTYCKLLAVDVENLQHYQQIPFLPISLFKSHVVVCGTQRPEIVFESSGTTNTQNSQHWVLDEALYVRSFMSTFEQFYGSLNNYCVLGLLPNYIEKGGSSLVYMVHELNQRSGHPKSGFFLFNQDDLFAQLKANELAEQPTLLIGVTYALLDFAANYPLPLKHTIIMETGGMKGRRKELTRDEVQEELKNAFGLSDIHSEYGMTELLSQAYATSNGLFRSPAWMKIVLREEDDPFTISTAATISKTGLINIIDLANLNSCSFIATDDVGKLHANGSFEVLGRRDNSDIRGCSLLAL